jgi:hypothetical protein
MMAGSYNQVRGVVQQLLNLAEKEYRLEKEITSEPRLDQFNRVLQTDITQFQSGTLTFILSSICTHNKKAREQLDKYIQEKSRSVALMERVKR